MLNKKGQKLCHLLHKIKGHKFTTRPKFRVGIPKAKGPG